MRIMSFDPGESTGWIFVDGGRLRGGTVVKDFQEIENLINFYNPEVVVYESFRLYPGKANSMVWNDFYPVQVIGVILFICQQKKIPTVEQAASVKKFSGGLDQRWIDCKDPKTEHTKDAYLHLKYYLLRSKVKDLPK